MIKKIFAVFFLIFIAVPAFCATQDDQTTGNAGYVQGNQNSGYPVITQGAQPVVINNAGLAQAKQDYRAYLAQLKQLNSQYKQITGQISQVLKEEGIPSWDSKTDSLTFDKPLSLGTTGATSDAIIQQTDKEMHISVDMPGLKKNTIKAQILDMKVLKITASRVLQGETIPIEKIIQLPEPAQDKGTEAKYEDGVLNVKIPKAAKKEITVPIQ